MAERTVLLDATEEVIGAHQDTKGQALSYWPGLR